MQKYLDVLRPHPTRTERCLILDKTRRVGGCHLMVQGDDGAPFMAVMYMGTWGQNDGWFDRRIAEIAAAKP